MSQPPSKPAKTADRAMRAPRRDPRCSPARRRLAMTPAATVTVPTTGSVSAAWVSPKIGRSHLERAAVLFGAAKRFDKTIDAKPDMQAATSQRCG